MKIKGYYDKQELLDKIYDIEGFHYFFMDHLDLNDVEDPVLLGLIINYREASDALEDYINSVDED